MPTKIDFLFMYKKMKLFKTHETISRKKARGSFLFVKKLYQIIDPIGIIGFQCSN